MDEPILPQIEESDLTEEELDELYTPVAEYTQELLTYEERLRQFQAKRHRRRRT